MKIIIILVIILLIMMIATFILQMLIHKEVNDLTDKEEKYVFEGISQKEKEEFKKPVLFWKREFNEFVWQVLIGIPLILSLPICYHLIRGKEWTRSLDLDYGHLVCIIITTSSFLYLDKRKKQKT
jgi:hypothetical protein